MSTRFALALLLLLLPLLCFAVPSGLNIMPTAESLGLGVTRLDFESDGSGKLYVPEGNSLAGTEAGLLLGIEGGIDDVPAIGAVYNLKWKFKNDGIIFPAMAIGGQNLAHGQAPQYYLVATKSLIPASKALQVSAGVLHGSVDNEGPHNLVLYGASVKLGSFTLKGDRATGSFTDRKSLGLSYTYTTFTVSGIRYFDKQEEGNKTTVMLSYVSKLL